jgi:hypothetical protein
MTILLRTVGVFYRADIDLGSSGGTVKDVLDAANSNGSNVTPFYDGSSLAVAYNDPTTGSPETFTATFKKSFTTPVVKTTYDPGVYAISENVSSKPVYSVWQYYLFDEKIHTSTVAKVRLCQLMQLLRMVKVLSSDLLTSMPTWITKAFAWNVRI